MTEIEKISEELFCLKYENSLFAQFVNYNKLERWIPGFSDKTTEDSHLKRYNFVAPLAEGKKVLDIACGVGRGSLIMAERGAVEVLGADIDQEALRYAEHRHSHKNVVFQRHDATKFVKPNYFDLIVSFETIEHLPDPAAFLKNVNTSLTDGGVFFVSTPISAKPLDTKPYNVYHIQEWGYSRFQEVVAEHLNVEQIILQLYPKRSSGRLSAYLNRLSGKTAPEPLSTIHTDLRNIKVQELGKGISGYQILKCRKK